MGLSVCGNGVSRAVYTGPGGNTVAVSTGGAAPVAVAGPPAGTVQMMQSGFDATGGCCCAPGAVAQGGTTPTTPMPPTPAPGATTAAPAAGAAMAAPAAAMAQQAAAPGQPSGAGAGGFMGFITGLVSKFKKAIDFINKVKPLFDMLKPIVGPLIQKLFGGGAAQAAQAQGQAAQMQAQAQGAMGQPIGANAIPPPAMAA